MTQSPSRGGWLMRRGNIIQNNSNDEAEIYRRFIKQMIEDITDVQDLKRIYTLCRVKYEKVT
jgi:hypothetical protein